MSVPSNDKTAATSREKLPISREKFIPHEDVEKKLVKFRASIGACALRAVPVLGVIFVLPRDLQQRMLLVVIVSTLYRSVSLLIHQSIDTSIHLSSVPGSD